MTVRNDVNKVLETYRTDGKIGSGLEAEIILHAGGAHYDALYKLKDELRFVFIVSKVTLKNNNNSAEITADVVVLNYQKCARCWHRREDVGADKAHPELCSRCVINITTGGESRQFA